MAWHGMLSRHYACHAMKCHAMPGRTCREATPCHARHAVPCRAMPCHAVLSGDTNACLPHTLHPSVCHGPRGAGQQYHLVRAIDCRPFCCMPLQSVMERVAAGQQPEPRVAQLVRQRVHAGGHGACWAGRVLS